ncbi:hypothetical protein CJ030_MR2G004217 [Morella rubra]|uniref:Protein N-lysine methyltransferase METTL21A n=1 Tax=Morella rubra TaxID=262757 RepID=A0A6A1WGE3_9ROSI|nr:hypothetical protein CJ030_MR2G004217 [Morella rubra]
MDIALSPPDDDDSSSLPTMTTLLLVLDRSLFLSYLFFFLSLFKFYFSGIDLWLACFASIVKLALVLVDDETKETQQSYVEGKHEFPGVELLIREFSFHQLNANLLWPGTFAFAEFLAQHRSWIEGRRCIELGSGIGGLAIYLRKSYFLNITTSDYDDQEIEENIAHNCKANGIAPVLPHISIHGGTTFQLLTQTGT